MMAGERIHIDLDYDCTGKTVMVVSNTNGAGLTMADLHNKFAEQYGGGVYAIVLNTNSGELVDKISSVTVYDVDDLFVDDDE